ncbi:halocyanin domain-containing protein [Haladaptatus sp. CMAA 1911]|uniref:halocyanin domain-containing protein n=1 Tax=unclassified Haladaptatus TaxID=2622732 RepID=UPI003754BB8D
MTAKRTDQRRRDATGSRTECDRAREEQFESTAINRRGFLRAAGVLAAVGLLAGCASDGSDDGGTNGSGGGETSVGEWLSETDNYESVTDLSRKEAVTVEVGPSRNEYAFEPAAIRISPGTAVTWKWKGSGYHNVVASDGEFESGQPEQKATFRHTFDSTGTTLYYCKPHESMGMKGAVVVASGNEETDADERSNPTGA